MPSAATSTPAGSSPPAAARASRSRSAVSPAARSRRSAASISAAAGEQLVAAEMTRQPHGCAGSVNAAAASASHRSTARRAVGSSAKARTGSPCERV
ncbi:MAG TPA: hypothetical protein VFS00_05645 [Polyangiaceae bacterium]|nr:hypothetical protein [Polyangiaceae bacterium]